MSFPVIVVAPPEPLPLLLTLEQVGRELNVTGETVRNYIKAGKLKAVRIGGKGWLRVRRSDLEDYVATLETTQERGARVLRRVR